MCGFCIEGGVVLDFVEREREGESAAVDNNDVGACLQEATNLADYLDRIRQESNFDIRPY